MTLQKRIPAPPDFPFFGWTEDLIKHYIIEKPLRAGDSMIIYNGQAGMHHYVLAEVENPALGKQKRVLLSKVGAYGGRTFYRTGKNCFSPTGQTRMLPPISVIVEKLQNNVDVWLTVSTS